MLSARSLVATVLVREEAVGNRVRCLVMSPRAFEVVTEGEGRLDPLAARRATTGRLFTTTVSRGCLCREVGMGTLVAAVGGMVSLRASDSSAVVLLTSSSQS